MKLPGKTEAINGIIVSTDKGWYLNAWNNFYPCVLFVNSNEVVLLKDNNEIYETIKLFYIQDKKEEAGVTHIHPNGNLDKNPIKFTTKEQYKNNDYYCFLKNPGDIDNKNNDMLSHLMALYSLAGLLTDYSLIVVYDKQSSRAISFKSPLDGNLINICLSKDGLTLLLMDKTHACILDNPLL